MRPGIDTPCQICEPGKFVYCESCHRHNCAVPLAPPMKVWVVVSDYGMNGIHVHGVYTKDPSREEVASFVMKPGPGRKFALTSVTGYGGTDILAFELDGELQ